MTWLSSVEASVSAAQRRVSLVHVGSEAVHRRGGKGDGVAFRSYYTLVPRKALKAAPRR